MDYFKHFNTVSYDIYGDGKTRNIADVFRKVRIDPKVLDDITFYRYYVITTLFHINFIDLLSIIGHLVY